MGVAVKPVGISAILSHIFLVHIFDKANFYSISGVFWFLGVLFDFYLLFPFLYKFGKNSKYGLELTAFLVFLVSLFASYYFHIKGDVFNKSILINLPCFVFGMSLAKNETLKIFSNIPKIFNLLFACTTILIMFIAKTSGFLNTSINLFAIIVSMLILLVCVCNNHNIYIWSGARA